jgi:hypothetical protein
MPQKMVIFITAALRISNPEKCALFGIFLDLLTVHSAVVVNYLTSSLRITILFDSLEKPDLNHCVEEETSPVSQTLCFLVFRIPEYGHSPEMR